MEHQLETGPLSTAPFKKPHSSRRLHAEGLSPLWLQAKVGKVRRHVEKQSAPPHKQGTPHQRKAPKGTPPILRDAVFRTAASCPHCDRHAHLSTATAAGFFLDTGAWSTLAAVVGHGFFVSRALVDIICRRSQLPVTKTKSEVRTLQAVQKR